MIAERKHTIMSKLLKRIVPVFMFAVGLFSLQGCALLVPQSNDAKIAKTAGSQYVISQRAETIDVGTLNPETAGSTIMSLVEPAQYDAALRSNGNSLGGSLSIEDPSSPILNRLGDFFQKKYDLKFVARGTINNIDPEYLNRQLQQGDYVIDVRLTRLQLLAQQQGSLFYLSGSFQFSIIDHKRSRTVLQDACTFSEPNNAQTVRYFSANQGKNISAFLSRYATPCLRYFALGEPLPAAATQQTAVASAPQQSAPQTSTAFTPATYTRVALGSGLSFYNDVGVDGTTLNDLNVSWAVGKKLTERNSLISRTSFTVFQPESFPTFTTESFYGASLGLGTAYHSSGDVSKGVELLLTGRISQTLQNGLSLSTNAVSLDLNAFYSLFGPLVGSVEYSFISHLGQADETRSSGHRLGVSLAYQFNL